MDTINPIQFILAFIFVLGLIGLFALLLKRLQQSQKMGKKLFGLPTNSGRIGVEEITYLDSRRKLVLVKRDDMEHLLLLADGRELIIESGIKGAKTASKDICNE